MYPRGSIYTTIMESGPQNHNEDGLLGPNSIVVVYMDPLGIRYLEPKSYIFESLASQGIFFRSRNAPPEMYTHASSPAELRCQVSSISFVKGFRL